MVRSYRLSTVIDDSCQAKRGEEMYCYRPSTCNNITSFQYDTFVDEKEASFRPKETAPAIEVQGRHNGQWRSLTEAICALIMLHRCRLQRSNRVSNWRDNRIRICMLSYNGATSSYESPKARRLHVASQELIHNQTRCVIVLLLQPCW